MTFDILMCYSLRIERVCSLDPDSRPFEATRLAIFEFKQLLLRTITSARIYFMKH